MRTRAALVVLLLVWGCSPTPDAPAGADRSDPPGGASTEPRLENADWRVEKMATAHGTMVIEVVTVQPPDGARALAIAQRVTEPLKGGYTEVLVLLRQENDASMVPLVRVSWTKRAGYQVSQLERP